MIILKVNNSINLLEMSMVKYKLPVGTGPIKKTRPYNTLTDLQKEIYKKVYDPINGILFFAENCCYVNRNGIQHYEPFDYQREMLFNLHTSKNVISLFGRQLGKTITTAIYILWYAMVFDHKQILVCAQSKDAASENLEKIRLAYEYCPNFLKRGIIGSNKTTMEFDNGSKIFVRPSNSNAPRGLTPALVYVDEFAFIGSQDSAEKGLEKQNEFFSALTPSLSSSQGSLFITSTPISETDLFFQLWNGAKMKVDDKGLDIPCDYMLKINGELYRDFHLFKAKDEAETYAESIRNENTIVEVVEKSPAGYNGFQSQLVTWDKCPLKTKEWADMELKRIGEERFNREYNCLSGDSLITIMDENGNIKNVSLELLYNFY